MRTHLQARARPLAHALLARGPLHAQLGRQRRLERCAVRRQALVLRAPPRPPAAPASRRLRIGTSAILHSVITNALQQTITVCLVHNTQVAWHDCSGARAMNHSTHGIWTCQRCFHVVMPGERLALALPCKPLRRSLPRKGTCKGTCMLLMQRRLPGGSF